MTRPLFCHTPNRPFSQNVTLSSGHQFIAERLSRVGDIYHVCRGGGECGRSKVAKSMPFLVQALRLHELSPWQLVTPEGFSSFMPKWASTCIPMAVCYRNPWPGKPCFLPGFRYLLVGVKADTSCVLYRIADIFEAFPEVIGLLMIETPCAPQNLLPKSRIDASSYC